MSLAPKGQKPKLPVSTQDMRERLGMTYSGWGSTVAEVRKAQMVVSDWAVSAALERWPRLLYLDETEVLAKVYENAEVVWRGFEKLKDEINEAERKAYLKAKAMA